LVVSYRIELLAGRRIVKLYCAKLYCPAFRRYSYDFKAGRELAGPSVNLKNNAYLVSVNRVQSAAMPAPILLRRCNMFFLSNRIRVRFEFDPTRG
jgi:hypothetical protein